MSNFKRPCTQFRLMYTRHAQYAYCSLHMRSTTYVWCNVTDGLYGSLTQSFVLAEVKSLRVQSMWLLNKALPQGRSQTSVYRSWIARHTHTLHTYCSWSVVACLIYVAMTLYIGVLHVWHHVRGKITSGVTVRGEGGVAGIGRVVGVPKFYS